MQISENIDRLAGYQEAISPTEASKLQVKKGSRTQICNSHNRASGSGWAQPSCLHITPVQKLLPGLQSKMKKLVLTRIKKHHFRSIIGEQIFVS